MTMGDATVERVSGDVYRVRVDIKNERLIPTITVRARENHVVRPDLLTVEGNCGDHYGWLGSQQVPSGTDTNDRSGRAESDHDSKREPGRTTRTIEYLVRGSGSLTVRYASVKGGTVSTTVPLP